MTSTTAEDLKRLIQTATSSKTPVKPKESSEYDLAALLSSVDITTPAKGSSAVNASVLNSRFMLGDVNPVYLYLVVLSLDCSLARYPTATNSKVRCLHHRDKLLSHHPCHLHNLNFLPHL